MIPFLTPFLTFRGAAAQQFPLQPLLMTSSQASESLALAQNHISQNRSTDLKTLSQDSFQSSYKKVASLRFGNDSSNDEVQLVNPEWVGLLLPLHAHAQHLSIVGIAPVGDYSPGVVRMNHTSYIFRFPVQYGKLPGFLRDNPQFKVIEIPAAATGQTALGIAMALHAAGMDERFKFRNLKRGPKRGLKSGIIVSDKYNPENMLMSKGGIVSSAEPSNTDPDQFFGMERHWNNIIDLIAQDFPERRSQLPALIEMVSNKLLSQYDQDLYGYNSLEKFSEEFPTPSPCQTRPSPYVDPWEEARRDYGRLFELGLQAGSALKNMLYFETTNYPGKSRDLIDIIRDNPDKVKGPRFIVMQSFMHLLHPLEREELVDALKTLPKGSVIMLGTNEYEPYWGETYAPQFFERLFTETSFRPIDGDVEDHGERMQTIARMDMRDPMHEDLLGYKLPGAYIKT
ncbi:MAG: hypothetical protein VKJ04_07880 [Vampirovibrionales bacterium]|nr:hypothetical protein [Vampirovibrionales bacterium]